MSEIDSNKEKKEEFPPLKRKKISKDEDENNERDNWNSILSPEVLESTEHFAKSYKESEPYPHGIISNICVDGFLGTYLIANHQNCYNSLSRLINLCFKVQIC